MHTFSFRPFDEKKMDALKTEISNVSWDQVVGGNILDIDDSCCKFVDFLNNLYTKHFPIKTKQISQKRFKNPWITTEIKRQINKKSEFAKLFRQGFISRAVNNQ